MHSLVVLALCLLCALTVAHAQATRPRAGAQYYLDTYGRADASDPLVVLAERIFARLLRVADRRGKVPPRLAVVAEDTRALALSLPDNHILLSLATLRAAVRGADASLDHARLAFILGHELAHFANGDFWHRQTLLALRDQAQAEDLRAVLRHGSDAPGTDAPVRLAVKRRKEMEADDRGFLYAALAGFAVDRLIGEPAAGEPDFFRYWAERTRIRENGSHPPDKDRATFLRLRLRELTSTVDLFRYALRLAGLDRHREAIWLLERVVETFPAREALNNLGVSYLHLARDALPPERAYRFHLPGLMDPVSRAARLTSRGTDGGPAQAEAWLQRAADLFARAAEDDPAYLPARLNLAATHLLRDQVLAAAAVVRKAEEIAPKDEHVRLLAALTHTLVRRQVVAPADPVPTASARVLAEAHPGARYNLARLLAESGRGEEAQALWRSVLAELPPAYRRQLCVEQRQLCVAAATVPEPPALRLTLPAPLGYDLYQDPDTLRPGFDAWERIPFRSGPSNQEGAILRGPDGVSLLTLDDYVEMVVLLAAALPADIDVPAEFGAPLERRLLVGGEMRRFAGARLALYREGALVEIAVGREPPPGRLE